MTGAVCPSTGEAPTVPSGIPGFQVLAQPGTGVPFMVPQSARHGILPFDLLVGGAEIPNPIQTIGIALYYQNLMIRLTNSWITENGEIRLALTSKLPSCTFTVLHGVM